MTVHAVRVAEKREAETLPRVFVSAVQLLALRPLSLPHALVHHMGDSVTVGRNELLPFSGYVSGVHGACRIVCEYLHRARVSRDDSCGKHYVSV